jgi:choline dehydrogenase
VIVVGAGSAGAVAARRLHDRGASVLLLEAGGPDVNPAIHDPARAHELWLAAEDWGHHTVPQAHAAGRRLHLPRGKVLGGSSSLNGMIWARGIPADYDGWARLGNTGWSWDDVLPVYRRIEDFDRGPSQLHGAGGPLRILSDFEPGPIHAAIVAAAAQTGIPFNPDYNSGTPDGISYLQQTIAGGRRHSTSAAYLASAAGRPGLTIVTGARARRLLLARGRATGVEWQSADGALHTARATSEVIVSAGAIESPRLLMLSGIGPAGHLRSLGIDVTQDLPGVGENLHDHLLSPVILSAQREIAPPRAGLWQVQTHLFARSHPGLPACDLQPLHFSVPMYEPWMEGPANAFTLMAGIVRPHSRGTIRLTGTAVDDELAIDPQALRAPEDRAALAAAVTLCREIGAAPALGEWGARELYPGPGVATPEELHDYVARTAITYHHQVGTCKMGTDPMAVVDPRLRVRGIDGLRVADASVMPVITTGNTHAPSVLIGEQVAAFVAGP